MKKRTFCMLILALVLISLFAIGASAEYYSNPIAVTYTMPAAGTSTEGFQDNFVLSAENSEIEIRTVYITNKNGKIVPIFVAGEEYICWVSFSGKNDSFAFSKGQNEQEYKAKVSVNGEELSASLLPGDIGLSDDSVVSIPKWDIYDIFYKESAPFLYINFSVIPESSPADRFKEVNISIAEDLAMTFYYTPEKNEPYTDFRTQATLQLAGGETVFAELRPWETEDGKKAFTFTGVAPQCMCDELTQILQGKKEDGTWEDIAQMSCSVREYCANLLSKLTELYPTSVNGNAEKRAKTETLMADLLSYGAAAQKYKNYRIDNLAYSGFSVKNTTFDANELLSTGVELTNHQEKNDSCCFYGATLVLDHINYITFIFAINPSVVSNATVELKDAKNYLETFGLSDLYKDKDGRYRCDSRALSLSENNAEITVSLFSNGELLQTVNYSVNCYVAKIEKTGDVPNISKLAQRLYCLGESAQAYRSIMG